MLEILVSLRREGGEGEISLGETSFKKCGDILVAKKRPAVWGNEEKRLFLITYLIDNDLESQISEVKSYPYAIYEERDVDGKTLTVMTNRSKYRVDVISPGNLFENSPGLDPEDIVDEPSKPIGKDYLEVTDLILDETSRID